MKYFAVPSLEHNEETHPENATRVPAILDALNADTTLNAQLSLQPTPPPASDDALATVHYRNYIQALREAMTQAPGYIDHAPTYITPESFECAATAAAAAINAVETAMTDKAVSASIARPPGHHAPPRQAMGFCLFNNVAVAARRAQQLGAERVMIYDFDVHHGNGTQDAFYSDPSVLFISSHQYGAGFYPGTGAVEEMGSGDGAGFNINIPLPGGAGDGAFRDIINQVVAPAADRFKPEVLLISAGYDAHWRDPLASLQLSCAGYHMLGTMLAEIANRHCDNQLAFVLEGGYDLPALSHGFRNTLRGALGLPVDDPLGAAKGREADIELVLKRVKGKHGLG
jgi:acetoin utilization deacetylase AcuC-like enzyme